MLLAVGLTLVPALSDAQVVEVGATMAAGCPGGDGSWCSSGPHPMPAAHASMWINDRVEVGVRAANLPLPNVGGTLSDTGSGTFEFSERSRQFFSLVLIYHFRAGKTVRPMVGLGTGVYLRSEDLRCEPSDCGPIGFPAEGRHRTRMRDSIGTAGLSVHVTRRWVVRGGILFHRFDDENRTMETFAGVGYRFGAR